MIPVSVLGAESALSTDIAGVVTTFTTGMSDVKDQALSLLNTAAPYIITIVAAVIVIKFGIGLLKHFKA
ncbi:MAG: hypothetical protein MR409_03240 [Lachnospiraceae bacterium]|nr:hypothetical protein [Lachnospiraceae bacterium]